MRKIPKDMTLAKLEEVFLKYGAIKSLCISLNSDHTSKGYGYICFEDTDGASRAIESLHQSDMCQAVRYQPKSLQPQDLGFKKNTFNNIYAKNFPSDWGET